MPISVPIGVFWYVFVQNSLTFWRILYCLWSSLYLFFRYHTFVQCSVPLTYRELYIPGEKLYIRYRENQKTYRKPQYVQESVHCTESCTFRYRDLLVNVQKTCTYMYRYRYRALYPPLTGSSRNLKRTRFVSYDQDANDTTNNKQQRQSTQQHDANQETQSHVKD